MTQNIRFFTLTAVIVLALSACTFNSTPVPPTPGFVEPIPTTTPVSAMSMVVSYDTTNVYDAVDQEVNYIYVIENTSATPLPGPITVTDDRVTVTCPGVETVGNLDANLDVGESITCTGPYKITQLDLNAGSFANTATASAGGNFSPAVTTTVTLTQTRALTLTKSANPTTYNNVDEKIIYTYTVKNTGNVTLGPAQFMITDNKFTESFICGSEGASLAPDETATCSRTYTITQADLDAGSVTNTATVSDGTTTSDPVVGIINKVGSVPGIPTQHTVVEGEWLWQIARCYGADPRQVVRDNPLPDPTKLKAGTIVTVNNVGKIGPVLGPPCIHWHTVVSGDTWVSIAQKFNNVDANLIQRSDVNPRGLVPGDQVRVPVGPLQYPP